MGIGRPQDPQLLLQRYSYFDQKDKVQDDVHELGYQDTYGICLFRGPLYMSLFLSLSLHMCFSCSCFKAVLHATPPLPKLVLYLLTEDVLKSSLGCPDWFFTVAVN